MNTIWLFTLLVCNKLIDCCSKLQDDRDGTSSWSSDGDDTWAQKNCYIALGFRIKDYGAIWIVLICTKQFEIDACYMGPSNEMTCNGWCTFHPMDAIVAITCYTGCIM
jgi:hypothetical protein